jgi:hypothetical protein
LPFAALPFTVMLIRFKSLSRSLSGKKLKVTKTDLSVRLPLSVDGSTSFMYSDSGPASCRDRAVSEQLKSDSQSVLRGAQGGSLCLAV